MVNPRSSNTPFTIFSDGHGTSTTAEAMAQDGGVNEFAQSSPLDMPILQNEDSYEPKTQRHLLPFDDDEDDEDAYETDDSQQSSHRDSISSLSVSTATSDGDDPYPLPNDNDNDPFTPTAKRTRNITSIHRSPIPPPNNNNPHLRVSHSLTPRSSGSNTSNSPRKLHARASPRPRTRQRQAEQEQDRLAYPLVLLHMTLLPSVLPWSTACLRAVLPAPLLDDLALLRTKVSEAVLARGVLVPHPGRNFEVLEERLLEALELVEGRVTPCGHFCGRAGVGFAGEGEEEEEESARADSALGDLADGERWCSTCSKPVRGLNGGTNTNTTNTKKWEVKVYAANGLMGTSAWAAAWSEMERVDIEIRPWIPEALRKRLDALREEEDETARAAAEADRLAQLESREDALRDAQELQHRRIWELEQRLKLEERMRAMQTETVRAAPAVVGQTKIASPLARGAQGDSSPAHLSDARLPPAYRPKDIPLEVLVRNYIYLLAQDGRNILIFLLGLSVLFLALRSSSSGGAPRSEAELGFCRGLNASVQQPIVVATTGGAELALDLGEANATYTVALRDGSEIETVALGKGRAAAAEDEIVESTQVVGGVDVESHMQEMDDMLQ